jgi:transcriptional regulator with XRE-family HTH domain
MTQQQLGDSAGIQYQQIQKYEAGKNRISVSRMWDIAAAMEEIGRASCRERV